MRTLQHFCKFSADILGESLHTYRNNFIIVYGIHTRNVGIKIIEVVRFGPPRLEDKYGRAIIRGSGSRGQC